ncbi:TPA: hypothetical protein ACSEXO_001519, partial [Proteus mirabilis]
PYFDIIKFAKRVKEKKLEKENIKLCAKEFIKEINYKELNLIHPLIKYLYTRINNSTNKEQKELLKNILVTSVDEHILFWSLALINDISFEEFMITPQFIVDKAIFKIQNT